MAAPRVDRRLAAILAADVVGYSRLTEQDEAGTIERLKSLRQQLIEPILAQREGRIVKLMGDGILAVFPSASEAVQAAVEVQQALAERERSRPEEERIRFRIGISLGDVVHEDGDIFGEGVNLAARLEGLAEPGGICVARNVYEQARNRLPVTFAPMGRHRVKNIAEPVELWRAIPDAGARTTRSLPRRLNVRLAAAVALTVLLLTAGAGAGLWWQQQARDAGPKVATSDILTVPAGPRVGVLPFANMSGDASHDFFADGITEQIIADLSRFRELQVVARNTMFRYKGEAVDVQELGRALALSYVLEGSVRLSPGSVRITAQLIDARDARQLWGETYDRPLTARAVIAVQEDVAARIVSAVGSSWGGAIASSRLKTTLGNLPKRFSSYECVLMAMAWYYYDASLYPRARDCLRETTTLEPDYTEAWAMLSDVYARQWYGYEEPHPDETYDPLERALEAARRAIVLSPDSARAHYAMAKAHLMAGDLDGFYAESQQALRLNPNEPVYLSSLGSWTAFTGRWDEGLALIDKAARLNPDSFEPCRQFAPALNHVRKGEYKEALACFQKSFSGWWVNYMQQAYTYGLMGDPEQARQTAEKLLELRPSFSIAEAIEFHRKYQFEQSYLGLVVEGLRRAGLPEGETTVVN